ncbi:MAG: sigma-54-dependent transcriptional regulator [bacterium]
MQRASVLIVDDEADIRDALEDILKDKYHVSSAQDGREAIRSLEQSEYDVVLLDLKMPYLTGMDVLREMRKNRRDSSVIMLTGYATVETAVEAMKLGAYDFIRKPIGMENVRVVVERAIERKTLIDENKYLHRQLEDTFSFSQIIGKSKRMRELYALLRKIAPTKTTVLIQGESGTGKEVVAKTIHYSSPRKDKRFIAINCGGVPETLLESELFGHTKGAFTGADRAKQGLFEAAEGGTIFLDEINTAPVSTQVKLLRVIEDSKFIPLGGTKEVTVDVRIMASSNVDLNREVSTGAFRRDLFYRLNVVRISLPPLRERREDISLLAGHFLQKYCREQQKTIRCFSPESMELFLRHDWPGNVRELENAVEHAVTLCTDDTVEVCDLPSSITSPAPEQGLSAIKFPFKKAKEAFEKEYIVDILKANGGNVAKSARMAQIARQNLHEKIKRYRINPKEYASI